MLVQHQGDIRIDYGPGPNFDHEKYAKQIAQELYRNAESGNFEPAVFALHTKPESFAKASPIELSERLSTLLDALDLILKTDTLYREKTSRPGESATAEHYKNINSLIIRKIRESLRAFAQAYQFSEAV